MARPRKFNEHMVLEAATRSFWIHGYEATSVRDLAQRMGLTIASLYNAFGDKRGLYRRVLDDYAASALSACAALFEGPLSPLEAIERFFDAAILEALQDEQRKGCLIVNTALEVAPHDEDFRAAVADALVQIEAYLRGCVARGQAEGTISQTLTAADMARMLLGALLGIRVLARTRPEPDLLTGMTRPLLLMLKAQ